MNNSKKSFKKNIHRCLIFDRINIPFKNIHVAITLVFIPVNVGNCRSRHTGPVLFAEFNDI